MRIGETDVEAGPARVDGTREGRRHSLRIVRVTRIDLAADLKGPALKFRQALAPRGT